MRMWKPTLRIRRHQHLPWPQGPHPAMATGMKDGRRLRGSAKGKERREGQDLEERWASRPGLTKLGAGGGVSVAVFIGGNRDARPQKARKPKKGPQPSAHTERQRRGGKGSGRVSPQREEAGAEELGAEAEELPLLLPIPSFMVSAGKRAD